MTEPIFEHLARLTGHHTRHAWDALTHHHPPSATMTTGTTPEAPVNLIQLIEHDAAQAGHVVDQALHDVLTHHLTLTSIAGHVAQGAAVLESDPVLRAIEDAAVPGLSGLVVRFIGDVTGFLAPTATEAPPVPVDVPQPEPAPAA